MLHVQGSLHRDGLALLGVRGPKEGGGLPVQRWEILRSCLGVVGHYESKDYSCHLCTNDALGLCQWLIVCHPYTRITGAIEGFENYLVNRILSTVNFFLLIKWLGIQNILGI